ncbi:MAG: hypothetical protein JNG88_10925 [Phycisphaerales bacterium]|nr:hypothetical protein [Phycisphaerales bacterium]
MHRNFASILNHRFVSSWSTALLLAVLTTSAGNADDTINRSILSDGSGYSSGGAFELHATLGQPVVVSVAQSPSHSLRGGFWIPPVASGDLNCDGFVNNFDIDAFVLALTNSGVYALTFPLCDSNAADVNHDGAVNNFDIDSFVTCLVNNDCP